MANIKDLLKVLPSSLQNRLIDIALDKGEDVIYDICASCVDELREAKAKRKKVLTVETIPISGQEIPEEEDKSVGSI